MSFIDFITGLFVRRDVKRHMDHRRLALIAPAECHRTIGPALENLGWAVSCVEASKSVAEQLVSEAGSVPSVIIIRVECPTVNGFLVCRDIWRSRVAPGARIIIYSSDATKLTFDQHAKLRSAADGYVMSDDVHDVVAEVGPPPAMRKVIAHSGDGI